MRTQKVQDKQKQHISIPSNLRKFLKNVYELILKKDESTTIESDDLLQDDFVYGGLIEQNGVEYGFTYFPEAGTRHKWELVFTIGQLKDIYEGKKKYVDVWACKSKNCHCKFALKTDLCFHCDYQDTKQD
jgi:hypothetical protein